MNNKNNKKPQTKKNQINKKTSKLSPNSYNAFNPFINPHDAHAAHSAQTTHSHNPFMTNTSSHSSHSSSPSSPYNLYNNEYHQTPHTDIDDFFDSDLYDPDWEEHLEDIEDNNHCELQDCDACPQKELCDELHIEFYKQELYKHAEFIRTALIPTDNPLSFQYYGLNPMKNFLYKHIGETFTAEYKKEYNLNPAHTKTVPFKGEVTKTLQGKIAELLVSESYAVFDDIEGNSIFVVTLNKDHLIFEMSYDEETETGGLSVDIYEGEEEYPCFACYDLTDYPSGYGLIIEIEPNVWKIV